MDIALIASKGLSRYSTLGDLYFIVPGYTSKDFYEAESKFKMLDNGAWEYGESIDTELLLSWAKVTRANEIVLPDVIMNKEQTLLRTMDFLSSITDKQRRYYSWAFVPQGRDPSEWIECYKLARETGYNTLCLPKWLESKFHARAKVIAYLKAKGFWDSRPHHLFGLDTLSEFFGMDTTGIRSIDSAKPITYAYHEKVLPIFESLPLERPKTYAKPKKLMDMYVAQNTQLFKYYANWRENTRKIVNNPLI